MQSPVFKQNDQVRGRSALNFGLRPQGSLGPEKQKQVWWAVAEQLAWRGVEQRRYRE